MRNRILAAFTAVVLALFVSSVLLAQSNPFIGTWKQDMAKSKYAPGVAAGLSRTITYESKGDETKYTNDAVRADGRHLTWSYTGRYDGKDHPITWTGAPNPSDQPDTISVKRTSANTYDGTQKKAGKVFSTARAVGSKDGTTMTITIKGTSANGQPVTSVTVYDKQ
jgi:hypothetical protein